MFNPYFGAVLFLVYFIFAFLGIAPQLIYQLLPQNCGWNDLFKELPLFWFVYLLCRCCCCILFVCFFKTPPSCLSVLSIIVYHAKDKEYFSLLDCRIRLEGFYENNKRKARRSRIYKGTYEFRQHGKLKLVNEPYFLTVCCFLFLFPDLRQLTYSASMPIVSGHNKRCSTTLIYGVNISSSGQKKLKTFYLIIKCCGMQGWSVTIKRKNNGMSKTSFDFNAWFVPCIPLNDILSRMSSGFLKLRCLHHADSSLAEDRNHRRRLGRKRKSHMISLWHQW